MIARDVFTQAENAWPFLADHLQRTRDYVKDRPHLQVRLFVDHHVISRRVVRADRQEFLVNPSTHYNPWTSTVEEFLKWKYEDGFLNLQEELHGGNRFIMVVRPQRVRLIQVIEPERILQDTVIPKVNLK
jgi:hypothetical protein